jgi:hypothetical protein
MKKTHHKQESDLESQKMHVIYEEINLISIFRELRENTVSIKQEQNIM